MWSIASLSRIQEQKDEKTLPMCVVMLEGIDLIRSIVTRFRPIVEGLTMFDIVLSKTNLLRIYL